jgi:hypothetical protein
MRGALGSNIGGSSRQLDPEGFIRRDARGHMRFSRCLPWVVLGLLRALPGSTQSPGLVYPTSERVRTDFRKLLERPHIALRPEFQF